MISESNMPTAEVVEPELVKPRIFTVILAPFVAIVLSVVLQGVLGAVLAVSMLAQGAEPDTIGNAVTKQIMSPPFFIAVLVLGQLGFALTAFVCGYLSPEPLSPRIGFPPRPAPLRIYVLTTIGSIAVLAISMAAVYLVALVIPPDKSLETLFNDMTIGWSIPFVILIGLLPGFIEEIFFRGYVQQRLLKRWSPPIAIGVSSFLFALAHISPHAIALAMIIGVWLGYIAWRCGSIGPGIACHLFINSGLNLWRMIVKFGEIPESTQLICSVVFVGIGIVGFILAMRELNKMQPPNLKALP